MDGPLELLIGQPTPIQIIVFGKKNFCECAAIAALNGRQLHFRGSIF